MASRLFLRPAVAMRPSNSIVTTASSSSPASLLLLRRTFAVTSTRPLKESAGEDKDYDKHKQDALAKQKQGKGHWKPELASDGEEAVKADRSPHEPIEKLQQRTKEHAQQTASTGTSGKDPM